MMDEWPIIEKKVRSMNQVFAPAEMGAGKVQVKEEQEEEEFGDTFDWGEDGESTPVPDLSVDEDVVQLSPHEWAVYSALDGEKSVQEVCYLSPLNEFGTCRTLYDLLSRNLIVEVGAKKATGDEPVTAAPKPESHLFLSGLGTLVLCLLLVGSLLTFWMNPFAPLGLLFQSGTPASSILADTSRLRLQRLDYAIQVYALQNGSLPESLATLEGDGFLSHQDTRDPWGKDYTYQPSGGEYTLTGFDSEGQVDPDLIILGAAPQVAARQTPGDS